MKDKSKSEKVKDFQLDTKKKVSDSEFKKIKNIQRPREDLFFKESTEEVKDSKGNIIGTGKVWKGILIINFKTTKYA